MNDFPASVADLLENLSPPTSRRADWENVLARAELSPTRTPRRAATLPRRFPGLARLAGQRQLVPLLGLPLFIAAVGAIALVLAWPFGAGSTLVIERAAAAIGTRPVTHVVADVGIGGSLVDLRTGKRTPVHGRSETWYDPKRGLLVNVSFRGQPVTRFVIPPSSHSAGFTVSPSALQAFAANYRAALQAKAFRVIGSGLIGGTPVYWIASTPSWRPFYPFNGTTVHSFVEEVAISKATYKAVYMRTRVDGRVAPGSGKRIVKIETIAAQPALFAHAPTFPGSVGLGSGYNGSSPQTTLADARAAMGRAPLVPSTTIAGLRRTWIGQPSYLSGAQNTYKDQLPGVHLYYGRLHPNGYGPPYQAPYISITEFPRANIFVREQGLGYFPGNDHAVLENNMATFEIRGLYVVIRASDPTRALAGAQALISP